jgi:hypothetical protein
VGICAATILVSIQKRPPSQSITTKAETSKFNAGEPSLKTTHGQHDSTCSHWQLRSNNKIPVSTGLTSRRRMRKSVAIRTPFTSSTIQQEANKPLKENELINCAGLHPRRSI